MTTEPKHRVRSRTVGSLLRFGRLVGTGMLAGLIAGFLAGGIGSRIAMRIVAVAGGRDISGLLTENGNFVGKITAEGTIFLLIAGSIAGVFGGPLYFSVRRWLPGPQWSKGLGFGVVLLLAFGSIIIDSDNSDFALLGLPLLSITLFASLFILYGVAAALIAERLHRLFRAPIEQREEAYVYTPLILFMLIMGVMGILIIGGAILAPLFLIAGLAVLLLGEFMVRSFPRFPHGRLATATGYVMLAVLCLGGLVLDVKSVSGIL